MTALRLALVALLCALIACPTAHALLTLHPAGVSFDAYSRIHASFNVTAPIIRLTFTDKTQCDVESMVSPDAPFSIHGKIVFFTSAVVTSCWISYRTFVWSITNTGVAAGIVILDNGATHENTAAAVHFPSPPYPQHFPLFCVMNTEVEKHFAEHNVTTATMLSDRVSKMDLLALEPGIVALEVIVTTIDFVFLGFTLFKLYRFATAPAKRSKIAIVGLSAIAVAFVFRIVFDIGSVWFLRPLHPIIYYSSQFLPFCLTLNAGYLVAIFWSEVLESQKLSAATFIVQKRKVFYAISVVLLLFFLVVCIIFGQVSPITMIALPCYAFAILYAGFTISYFITQSRKLLQHFSAEAEVSRRHDNSQRAEVAPQSEAPQRKDTLRSENQTRIETRFSDPFYQRQVRLIASTFFFSFGILMFLAGLGNQTPSLFSCLPASSSPSHAPSPAAMVLSNGWAVYIPGAVISTTGTQVALISQTIFFFNGS